MRCDLTQCLLCSTNILQQPDRVEAFELRLQPRLDRRLYVGVSQKPLAGRRRCKRKPLKTSGSWLRKRIVDRTEQLELPGAARSFSSSTTVRGQKSNGSN